jgi:acyl dehydratase
MTPAVGTSLLPLRIDSVSPASMQQWAGFLHDPNPIHLDPAVVKAKGWGDRVINQGPANLAYIITMLQKALPGATLEALDVRYVDNVFGGESVEAGGKVKEISQQQGDARGQTQVTCDVWLRAPARDFVITGTAVLSV